jgi:hypothetical protein
MAINRARTLGIHFSNNCLQAELLHDIRGLLEELRGYNNPKISQIPKLPPKFFSKNNPCLVSPC